MVNKVLSFTILTTLVMTTMGASIPILATKSSQGSGSRPDYDRGYAQGVKDAKATTPTSAMSPDNVDCDSDVDPQLSNRDYCSGYQHGYADENNMPLNK
jgi:hypothetical protein